MVWSLGTFFFVALAGASERHYLAGDFFVTVGMQPGSKDSSEQTDCRANIRHVMCLVDPAVNGEDPNQRKCLQGGENYATFFEALHDHYPKPLQKMFCSLRRIFVEKEFFGTAYAGLLEDATGKRIGAIMGIRRSVLDENLSLTTWATWKEQLSFGGAKDSYTPTPGLPRIETQSSTKVSDFLYFVVAHEFGHIFDFSNDLNKTKDCPAGDCEFEENTWGALSWVTGTKPKPENEFLNRDRLCFYSCNGNPLNPSAVPQLYESLFKTDFLSTYAATDAWQDLADSLAYYLMERNLSTSYFIDTRQGARYDISEKVRSADWAQHAEYLENFLQKTDIVYP